MAIEKGHRQVTGRLLVAAAVIGAILIAAAAWLTLRERQGDETMSTDEPTTTIILPDPRHESSTSVEEALLKRRSVRSFKDGPLTLAQVSQLLWAAQGVTSPRGFRTAPSAGALYPLEVYVVVGDAEGIESAVYRYRPEQHHLALVATGDKRSALAAAAMGQPWIRKAAIDIVFSAVYERTTNKYGLRGAQYVHMEVGHAAQNVYLQAVSLNLGTVVVGAFDDEEVKGIVRMPDSEHPLCIMAVGRR